MQNIQVKGGFQTGDSLPGFFKALLILQASAHIRGKKRKQFADGAIDPHLKNLLCFDDISSRLISFCEQGLHGNKGDFQRLQHFTGFAGPAQI